MPHAPSLGRGCGQRVNSTTADPRQQHGLYLSLSLGLGFGLGVGVGLRWALGWAWS